MMTTEPVYCFLLFIIYFTTASFVYHENTNVMFSPVDEDRVPNDYFGYSIILTTEGLYVGAPKTKSYFDENVRTGHVFVCSLEELEQREVACYRAGTANIIEDNLFVDFRDVKADSWFGASMAFLGKDKLMITAPRETIQITNENGTEYQIQGAGYFATPRRKRELHPLHDAYKLHDLIVLDGQRPEYGNESGAFYYAHGQAGFSLAVTKMNTVVFGAPGLLAWTGGVVPYAFHNKGAAETEMQPITNTYKTEDLGPYDFFGYSVESGIFQKNGSVLYVAGAPRSELAQGKVLIFKPPTNESDPLDIKAKLIGPQVGSYFGATLCCTDINEDGLDDLLVGAPTYVNSKADLSHDEGAVFVYITRESDTGFVLEECGHVSGSRITAARFGSSIADLGDIDGDGFKDIAIGAPYEDNGAGAVYIYKGHAKGLSATFMQRIQPSDAKGFGWSISKGVDIDKNDCNDLAIGAYASGTSYVYRCIPTMSVHATIGVAKIVNLQHNATTFTAWFNISTPPITFKSDVKINLIGRIKVDPEYNRAVVTDPVFKITAMPGKEECNEKTINVNITGDLLMPMLITFDLDAYELMKENSTTFLSEAARLSENSTLKTSTTVQIVKDCGDDLICNPWLHTTLEPLDSPYTPGTNQSLGLRYALRNLAEPAYGLKVIMYLPIPAKKIPNTCSLDELIITCYVPQPFKLDDTILWEVELEYNLKAVDTVDLVVITEVVDKYYSNITNEYIKTLTLQVTPEVDFRVGVKSMPNDSITISRDDFTAGSILLFKHYFEITNLGPSDWHALTAIIRIPDKTSLSSPIEGCEEKETALNCTWAIPAKVSFLVSVPLQLDFGLQENFSKNMTYNAISSIRILQSKHGSLTNYKVYEVTTTLILEPGSFIWYIVGACVLIGLLLLMIIVLILNRSGFFTRTKHEQIKANKKNRRLSEVPHSVSSTPSEEEFSEIERLQIEDSDSRNNYENTNF